MEFCNKVMVWANPLPPPVMVKDHTLTIFGTLPLWVCLFLEEDKNILLLLITVFVHFFLVLKINNNIHIFWGAGVRIIKNILFVIF